MIDDAEKGKGKVKVEVGIATRDGLTGPCRLLNQLGSTQGSEVAREKKIGGDFLGQTPGWVGRAACSAHLHHPRPPY
jgi:hypothetical protein